MDEKEQHILQKHLSQFLITEVFNCPTSDDILQIKAPNVWLHKGQQLDAAHIKDIKTQAQHFKDSRLWKILREELLYLAYEKGYVKSQTESDMIAGKLLGYIVQQVDKKLKEIGT